MERCILALAMTNGMEIKAFRVQNLYDNTEFWVGGGEGLFIQKK